MASDRFGEELAPDAAIWNIYMDEVEEHDNELVSRRQQSLDTLLLFAALFSAVLTAFLVESKDLLQQDPEIVSIALLLAIAQSQQRMELGLPAPQGSITPVSVPDFEPLWSARWVNGIWFTALGLSLSAALIAMLAKEWLSAYLSFRPRSARRRAFIRQSRLQGLEDWWALHIVDLLPTLLHASLLLFSVGLVIYLWDYDVAVAAVLSGVIGLTLTFYLVTGILGATFEFCPFVTEVSGYIRRAVLALFSPSREQRPENNNESAAPSIQDLKALLWLANNARDPSVVDYSYQAMAGLHASTYIKSTSITAQLNSDVGAGATHEGPIYVYRESTLASLLDTVVARFEGLLAGTLETGSGEPP
ncbi:putative transmembrane protein, partial [Rhizoctonia solani 123E]